MDARTDGWLRRVMAPSELSLVRWYEEVVLPEKKDFRLMVVTEAAVYLLRLMQRDHALPLCAVRDVVAVEKLSDAPSFLDPALAKRSQHILVKYRVDDVGAQTNAEISVYTFAEQSKLHYHLARVCHTHHLRQVQFHTAKASTTCLPTAPAAPASPEAPGALPGDLVARRRRGHRRTRSVGGSPMPSNVSVTSPPQSAARSLVRSAASSAALRPSASLSRLSTVTQPSNVALLLQQQQQHRRRESSGSSSSTATISEQDGDGPLDDHPRGRRRRRRRAVSNASGGSSGSGDAAAAAAVQSGSGDAAAAAAATAATQPSSAGVRSPPQPAAAGGRGGDTRHILLFRQIEQEILTARDLASKLDLVDELSLGGLGSAVVKRLFFQSMPLFQMLHRDLAAYWATSELMRNAADSRFTRADEIEYAAALVDLLVRMLEDSDTLPERLALLKPFQASSAAAAAPAVASSRIGALVVLLFSTPWMVPERRYSRSRSKSAQQHAAVAQKLAALHCQLVRLTVHLLDVCDDGHASGMRTSSDAVLELICSQSGFPAILRTWMRRLVDAVSCDGDIPPADWRLLHELCHLLHASAQRVVTIRTHVASAYAEDIKYYLRGVDLAAKLDDDLPLNADTARRYAHFVALVSTP